MWRQLEGNKDTCIHFCLKKVQIIACRMHVFIFQKILQFAKFSSFWSGIPQCNAFVLMTMTQMSPFKKKMLMSVAPLCFTVSNTFTT